MKVLVTGHLGYLGKVLTKRLEEKGYEWVGLDIGLNRPGELDKFQDVRRAKIRDVDAIIHLAAIVGEPACMLAPELARSINLDGSVRVIDQAVKLGVPLIFASTCSVYGAADDLLFEHSKTNPLGPYARDRLEAEQYAIENEAISLRFGTLFGWSSRWRTDLVINKWAQETALKEKIQVTGGRQWRPFCHVEDAAEAICVLLEKQGDGGLFGKVFNCASFNSTIMELANQFKISLGANVEIQDKVEDIRNYKVSSDRLTGLGWNPDRSIRETLQRLLVQILASDHDPKSFWWSNLEVMKRRIQSSQI